MLHPWPLLGFCKPTSMLDLGKRMVKGVAQFNSEFGVVQHPACMPKGKQPTLRRGDHTVASLRSALKQLVASGTSAAPSVFIPAQL